MGDALRKTFTGLDGRDNPVLQGAAGAISCRFLVGLSWSLIRPPIRPLELTPIASFPGIRLIAARVRYVRRTNHAARY